MTSENTKRRSRLFSLLMVEEAMDIGLRRNLGLYYDYLTFIKAQRNTRNPWCPYSMAAKALEAR